MKLEGKYLGEINSSFVEFEVDELISSDDFDEIKEQASCYEAIWQGKSDTFSNGISLMIGFDNCEDGDLDLLEDYVDSDSMDTLKEMLEDSQRVRF
jgi:hypothetical protein